MDPAEPLRICSKCRIPHYENCPDCFGWGRYRSFKDDQVYPVTAAVAHGEAMPLPRLEPCPTCKSTIGGVLAENPLRVDMDVVFRIGSPLTFEDN